MEKIMFESSFTSHIKKEGYPNLSLPMNELVEIMHLIFKG
jgi:hypothetical protein